MKRISVIALGMLIAAQANAALASDGTITFTGEIKSQTCTVSVNGGGSDATVTLPTVASSLLDTQGDTAGNTRFTLALSGTSCTSGNAYAYFEQGANVDTTLGMLTNNGTASNVVVSLKDGNDQEINIGSDEQSTSPVTVALNGSEATLTYSAEYYATGAATAGTVSTSVTYSINYL